MTLWLLLLSCGWRHYDANTYIRTCLVLTPVNTHTTQHITQHKAAIDQSTISRRVGAPCFGDPKQQQPQQPPQQQDTTTPPPYLGRSGAWVRWNGARGELEVGWRPGASIYHADADAGVGEGNARVWRTPVGFAGEGDGGVPAAAVRVGRSRLEGV